MATTSYLCRTLGRRGYTHLKAKDIGGGVGYHVRRDCHRQSCRGFLARWNALQMDGGIV